MLSRMRSPHPNLKARYIHDDCGRLGMHKIHKKNLDAPAFLNDLYARERPNSLNFLRLILAATVIIWHTYSVTGMALPGPGLSVFLGGVPVNGFFAISGYLIYASWIRNPDVGNFLIARALRIYPAFWVCLIVTAFIIAPAAVMMQGKSGWEQALSAQSFSYVFKNASLAMLQWRIEPTPTGVPWTTSWDASLWTLAWEFLCYLGILFLGLLGMAKRRWLLPVAFLISLALNIFVLFPAGEFKVLERIARFSIFFLSGSMAAQYAKRIPASRLLMAACLFFALAASWAPAHNIFQAPTLAVGLLLLGGLFNPSWAEFKNDFSYGVYVYGFPVQQLLATAGLTSLGLLWFSLIAFIITLPLAAASWYLIEKPALGLRKTRGVSIGLVQRYPIKTDAS